MNDSEITEDDFLGGRIRLKQPRKGYRISSDTVFLAATLSFNAGAKVLDVGSGSGGILSCLQARIGEDADEYAMFGVEIQNDLIKLAKENCRKATYINGDIMGDIDGCDPNSFDHVVSNPPYYEKGKASKSPYRSKAVAHGGDMDAISLWVERCLRMVKPNGYLTLIHRADRFDDILVALKPKSGSIIVFPFHPKEGKEANRIIIRAQKGGKGLLSLKSGMIVHKSDGNYTEAAENILRNAFYLNIEQ